MRRCDNRSGIEQIGIRWALSVGDTSFFWEGERKDAEERTLHAPPCEPHLRLCPRRHEMNPLVTASHLAHNKQQSSECTRTTRTPQSAGMKATATTGARARSAYAPRSESSPSADRRRATFVHILSAGLPPAIHRQVRSGIIRRVLLCPPGARP